MIRERKSQAMMVDRGSSLLFRTLCASLVEEQREGSRAHLGTSGKASKAKTKKKAAIVEAL